MRNSWITEHALHLPGQGYHHQPPGGSFDNGIESDTDSNLDLDLQSADSSKRIVVERCCPVCTAEPFRKRGVKNVHLI